MVWSNFCGVCRGIKEFLQLQCSYNTQARDFQRWEKKMAIPLYFSAAGGASKVAAGFEVGTTLFNHILQTPEADDDRPPRKERT